MWWLKKRQVAGLVAALAVATAVGSASAQSLSSREAELSAKESRLSLWEDDLARRAEGDKYFDNLEGYVTPREMARMAFLTLLMSIAASVITVRFLQSRSLLGGVSAERQHELARTEKRVLTGLGELEGLLDRFYRALETEPAPKPKPQPGKMRIARTRGAKRRPAPVDDTPMPSAPPARPASPTKADAAETTDGVDGGWRDVVRLAKTGLDPEAIAERLRLHPSEVEFILKVDARR